jgi:hypothetical protein
MTVRVPLITEDASRILLEGIVDYAGLYPPASVTMQQAVRNYAHYRAGGTGWMLGRFVCAANALEEFSVCADPLLPRDAGAIPWRLSVVGGADVVADVAAIAAFNARHRVCFEECGALVDAYEARVQTVADVQRLNEHVPREMQLYCEVVPSSVDALFPAIAAAERRVKLRAGGVQPEAFPADSAVMAFLHACVVHGVVGKATAGLHHPLCGAYRLTYQPDAPTGPMFGYLNVFLAAALLAQGESVDTATALLRETDRTAVRIDPTAVTWQHGARVVRLERAVLQRTREQVLVSFGSCSFTEPVEEIRAIGWI